MTVGRWAGGAVASLMCATVMSGCATSTTSTPDPRLVGTWHLVEAVQDGAPLALNGSDITLTISDSRETGGESMCAPYAAKVIGTIGSVFIKVQSESTTRDACIPNALVNVGDQYLNTLRHAQFASITNGALVLTAAHDSLLFVRSAPHENPTLQGTSWTLYSPPQEKNFTRTARSGPISLTFEDNNRVSIGAPCVQYDSTLETAGSTSAAASFNAGNVAGPNCTDRDRLAATAAASALIGPMLITLSNSSGTGDPATLVITNLNTSIPTVWRADR